MTIALITGGSRGLGRSMALHLAKAGTDIVLTYKADEAAAHAVVADIRALGRTAAALRLDVADSTAFPAFVAALAEHLGAGKLDYLVNNAGTGLHASFAETTEAQLDELYRVHLKGPYFLTQQLLPLLADGGRIVNIGTGLDRFTYPGASAYAAMKGAIEVLTRYQARELGPRGITVNALAPGAIATDFNGGTIRDNPAVNKMVADATALGRVGLPDDIGAAITMILSPASAWMTGQRIECSGGQAL